MHVALLEHPPAQTRPEPPAPARGHAAASIVGTATCAAGAPALAGRPRVLYIHGVTLHGRAFRPSDWAERLARAMSSFRPKGSTGGIGAHIGYSPYCVPRVVEGVKCVMVSEALRDIEPMAWDFVMNFAADNELAVVDVHRTAPVSA